MSSPTPTPEKRRLVVPFVLLCLGLVVGFLVAFLVVFAEDPADDIPASLVEDAEIFAEDADRLANGLADAADVIPGPLIDYAADLADNLAEDAGRLANSLADGADDPVRLDDLIGVGKLADAYAELANGLDNLADDRRLTDLTALAKVLADAYADLDGYLAQVELAQRH